MPFVSYVEFNVKNLPETAAFYQKVFGWNLAPFGDENYLVASHGDGPGIDAGFQVAEDGTPRTVATITVDAIDEAADMVVKHGGTIVVEKFTIPTVGYAMYFLDPGGMVVGLHQYDPSAG